MANRKPPSCPVCDAPTAQDFRPFCSRRCADVDLARWLKGAYAIPVVDADDDEDGDDISAEVASRGAGPRDDR